MRLLLESAILLRRAHGTRLREVSQSSTPIGLESPHVFSFFLDAELPEPTTTAQLSLNLTVEIEVHADRYVAVGTIAWQSREVRGKAIASPWDYLEVPELEASHADEFFEKLPGYVAELVERHQRALRDYFKTT